MRMAKAICWFSKIGYSTEDMMLVNIKFSTFYHFLIIGVPFGWCNAGNIKNII
jgi:hypothetical protein